jgi:hypothetical protein
MSFRSFGLITICFCTISVRAQNYPVIGFVKDSITQLPIKGAKVTNTSSKKTAYTDYNGLFHIEASPDELLRAIAAEYHPTSIIYSPVFRDTILIYLATSGKILPSVTVASNYTKYQMDSMSRKKEFGERRGNHVTQVSRAEGFGIAVSLDKFFKAKYKFQRKNEKRFNAMEQSAYVTYRYSPKLVAFYTGLKGVELQAFMSKHTPTYQWLRKHLSNDEVLEFINSELKLYRASKL